MNNNSGNLIVASLRFAVIILISISSLFASQLWSLVAVAPFSHL